ncbi:hypothetical protein RQP54_16575 [Curvibacter sp. APW13]|uniref:hypothetical protein n=1 Tax=Curvibacter sp. APW13 TaxID=3077236 RepID=UPI0028DFB026|nr:hypothetical protein [Curvibacter sp. APW13]MDT8992487.1 hypothetical protein [Curvibacter sp. APW13]
MRIVLGFLSASVWLVVLLSGMYWGVSADVSTDGWVGMLFLLTLSLALACSGVFLLLWAGRFERLRTPGWVLLGCAILFWMGDGLVAGLLMVVPSLGYAAWAGWKSFAEFMSQPPILPTPTDEREP